MINRSYICQPEHYMSVPQVKNFGDVDIDALQCALNRAEALSIILGAQFDGKQDGFNESILLYVTNALEATISQAQLLLNGTPEANRQ